MTASEWHTLPGADAIVEGQAVSMDIAGQPVLLVRSNDRLYAIADRCTHADQELACGIVRHGWIACPAHGTRFLLETGEPMNPPATEPLATYPVRIRDGVGEVCLASAKTP